MKQGANEGETGKGGWERGSMMRWWVVVVVGDMVNRNGSAQENDKAGMGGKGGGNYGENEERGTEREDERGGV